MGWSALLTTARDDPPSPTDAALQALAIWALQFTPRVTVVEEAVLLELGASLRLFGGQAALDERFRTEGSELGVGRVAWAPNALAALALVRGGVCGLVSGDASGGEEMEAADDTAALTAQLDRLPMEVLSAVRPHRQTLARIGCRTLGDVRRLPRQGMARRFDAALLRALDQVYGLAPQTWVWVALPEVFDARLELPHRVEDAAALVFGARRLLLQLGGWLAARHSGVTAFTLHWAHDAMRSRGVGEGGQLTVRTAEPTREVGHLVRLLGEHLGHLKLEAAVGDLRLTADGVVPLAAQSASWLPDEARGGEPLPQVLERLAARLGEERVVRPLLCEDHRPEWMCRWQPAGLPLPRRLPSEATTLAGPQPGFLLAQPLKLLMRRHHPLYEGELQMLLGPQRVEGGWWDRDEAQGQIRHVVRDYWVAASERAGLLWVFQTRLADEPAWYLHGFFV